MKGYLLDTNVVSMLSPSRAPVDERFGAWLERADDAGSLYLCVVTIHEIEKGIALLDHRQATAKATALRGWLTGLHAGFASRILALDPETAAVAGRLEAKALADGHSPGMADAMIAGIAFTNELLVVTQNRRHFVPFGIPVATPDELGAATAER